MLQPEPMRGWLLPLATVLVFGAPYCTVGAYKFVPATIELIALYRLAGRAARLGLRDSPRWIALCLALALLLAGLFRPLILNLAAAQGLAFRAGGWGPALPAFQALNEELVFRALLLGALARRFGRGWPVSASVAGLFALAHAGFYTYSVDGTVLAPGALLTLFLFGLLLNDLYLRRGSIWAGYAVHVAWNLTRLGGLFYRGTHRVAEGQTFNLLEGSREVVALTLSAAALYALGIVALRPRAAGSSRPAPASPAATA